MNIKLETLLAILFTNGMENVVTLAVKIDANITVTTPIPTKVPVSIYKDDLLPGTEFSNRDRSATVLLDVVSGPSMYSLKQDEYYVQLPNGNVVQKTFSRNTVRSIVAESVVTEPAGAVSI